MSIQHYEEALKLIREAGGGDFEGAKPASLLAKAESALGLVFPPSYRRFLLELGCGDINGFEVLGLINDEFQRSTVPNGIWLTLNERRGVRLDPAYVLVGEGGDGTFYALDTREVDAAGENPVVRLSAVGKPLEKSADSFGSFLLNEVSAVV